MLDNLQLLIMPFNLVLLSPHSFGMFMKPLQKEMSEGNFGVSFIGSIQVKTSLAFPLDTMLFLYSSLMVNCIPFINQVAIYLSSGPFVAGLVSKYGNR